MKKLLSLFLLCFAWLVSFADNKASIVDSSDNVLDIEVLKTDNIARIPVRISMKNPSVAMTCVQCHIEVSDSAAVFCKNEEEKNFIYSSTSRWTPQHQVMFAMGTKKYPRALMAILASTISENFKDDKGPLLTVYVDGSSLKDGDYTVSLRGSNMVWTDKREVRTYLTPDTSASFSVKEGKVFLP